MKEYYYLDENGIQQGPFYLETLKDKKIHSKTKIWYDGLKKWVDASSLEELRSFVSPVPPKDDFESKPDNFLAWSIISAILCCFAFSIPAIIYAAKVDTLWICGKYEESRKAAKNAKIWTFVSAGVAVIFWVFYIVFIVALGLIPFMLNSNNIFDF